MRTDSTPTCGFESDTRHLLAKATIVHGAEIWPIEPPANPA